MNVRTINERTVIRPARPQPGTQRVLHVIAEPNGKATLRFVSGGGVWTSEVRLTAQEAAELASRLVLNLAPEQQS